MPSMSVAGAGPYSVQCAVTYSASEPGVQVEYTATDASGQLWISGHAAAPRSRDPGAAVVFVLESGVAPGAGNLTLTAKLIAAAQNMATNELSATIDVRH